MKILVAVKRVIDYHVKIRVKADGSGVETQNVKMSLNPFDEIALEEAIRLKEAGHAQSVVAVSIGPTACQESLRTALAMGADEAILVQTESDLGLEAEPLLIAKVLQAITQQQQPQLILLGKQAIDDDCNQTGQMLAALLDWPQATYAAKLTVKTPQQIEVVREIDGGLETLLLQLPAVVTTDLRLNQPRYVTLPNIMRAKQKPLTTVALSDLAVTFTPTWKILSVQTPTVRKAGIKTANVMELLQKLTEEAKVL